MLRSYWGQWRRARDEGTALVAAVAVAIIGVSLTTVVVSQAIVVTNDTAKDRIRTAEVHSAESAIDQTLSVLATSSPCPGPNFSPLTVGEGTDSAIVTVTVDYYAGNTKLSCVSGVPVGSPTRAVVSAVATPGVELPGSQPVRTMVASVNLKPQTQSIPGAAIFSATAIETGGGFELLAADGTKTASIWIDSGDYVCKTSTIIRGSVYVVNGSASMQQASCMIDGSVWARNNFTSCCTPSFDWQVAGSLTARYGTVTMNNRNRIQGDIAVGGNVTLNVHWTNTIKGGGVCAANLTPCAVTSFENYVPIGLPEIDLEISDWQPTAEGVNFQRQYRADFGQAILQSWGLTNPGPTDWGNLDKKDKIVAAPCKIASWMSSAPVFLPSTTSSTPTVFDMRNCDFIAEGGVTLRIKADVAIFAKSFTGTNGLKIESADGQPHRVWFIVPEGGAANNGIAEKTARTINVNGTNVSYTPGNISFATNNALVVDPLIDLLLYTPQTLTFSNPSSTHGQMYGGTVKVGGGGGKFYYSQIGVPGVNMSLSTGGAAGYKVEIVNKREVKQ